MTFTFGKTSFAPVMAIIGCTKYGIPVIPVAEYIARHIVRIYIFGVFKPFMMKNL